MAWEEEAPKARNGFTAPYTSWKTFLNLILKMEEDQIIPTRFDRSYLKTYAGAEQNKIFQAYRSLQLIDDKNEVLPALRELVTEADKRPQLIKALLERFYPWALSLGLNATQAQLDEAFSEH